MAHSYKTKGPVILGESFKFDPDTRVLTIGTFSITLPESGTNLGDLVAGVGFSLPAADPSLEGALWDDAGVVTVSHP